MGEVRVEGVPDHVLRHTQNAFERVMSIARNRRIRWTPDTLREEVLKEVEAVWGPLGIAPTHGLRLATIGAALMQLGREERIKLPYLYRP